MPDLDLIKQAELGDAGVRATPIPSLSGGSMKSATNAGELLLICCRCSKGLGWRFNEWL